MTPTSDPTRTSGEWPALESRVAVLESRIDGLPGQIDEIRAGVRLLLEWRAASMATAITQGELCRSHATRLDELGTLRHRLGGVWLALGVVAAIGAFALGQQWIGVGRGQAQTITVRVEPGPGLAVRVIDAGRP